jgi:hypothetical protein
MAAADAHVAPAGCVVCAIGPARVGKSALLNRMYAECTGTPGDFVEGDRVGVEATTREVSGRGPFACAAAGGDIELVDTPALAHMLDEHNLQRLREECRGRRVVFLLVLNAAALMCVRSSAPAHVRAPTDQPAPLLSPSLVGVAATTTSSTASSDSCKRLVLSMQGTCVPRCSGRVLCAW